MDIRVAIVDDTETDRARLADDVRSALAARGVSCVIAQYASAEEMLAAIGGNGDAGIDARQAGGAASSARAAAEPNAGIAVGPTGGVFDLAFLDVRMEGGMDGIALAEWLRARDRALVIVFVTTSREYALDAYRTHPFDYLVKPYDQERLDGLLDDVLGALVLFVPYARMVDLPLPKKVFCYANAAMLCAFPTL